MKRWVKEKVKKKVRKKVRNKVRKKVKTTRIHLFRRILSMKSRILHLRCRQLLTNNNKNGPFMNNRKYIISTSQAQKDLNSLDRTRTSIQ